ncbi:MAG: VanZ family protein [Syntrophothermus sp.]
MSDKIQHFGAYMVLAVLLCLTYSFQQKFNFLRKNPFLYTFVTIFSYGGLDELHQLFIPGRSCDVRDLIADVTGALIGIGVVYLIKIVSKKPFQDLPEN